MSAASSPLTLNFVITVVSPAPPPPPVNPLLLVDDSGNPLQSGETITLANETVGVQDNGQFLFTVKGGVPPYSYVTDDSSLPDGDSFTKTVNADGSETIFLEGTPTTAGNNQTFSVEITDSSGQVAMARGAVRKPITQAKK
jgi:hypothetical protein